MRIFQCDKCGKQLPDGGNSTVLATVMVNGVQVVQLEACSASCASIMTKVAVERYFAVWGQFGAGAPPDPRRT